MTRIFSNAVRIPGEIGASAPPASIIGHDAGADQHRRVADRVGAARAAGGEHVRRAAQAKRDRQLAGEIAVRAGGDGEERAVAFGEEGAVLLLDERQPPAAGAERDADLALGARRRRLEVRAPACASASRDAARAIGIIRGTRRSSTASMAAAGRSRDLAADRRWLRGSTVVDSRPAETGRCGPRGRRGANASRPTPLGLTTPTR